MSVLFKKINIVYVYGINLPLMLDNDEQNPKNLYKNNGRDLS